MAENNSYDLPVMVGFGVVGLIAAGIFFYMRQDPVAPPAPREPVVAPLNVSAVDPLMTDTSGGGQQAQPGAMGGGMSGGLAAPGGGGGMAGAPSAAPVAGGGGGAGLRGNEASPMVVPD